MKSEQQTNEKPRRLIKTVHVEDDVRGRQHFALRDKMIL